MHDMISIINIRNFNKIFMSFLDIGIKMVAINVLFQYISAPTSTHKGNYRLRESFDERNSRSH